MCRGGRDGREQRAKSPLPSSDGLVCSAQGLSFHRSLHPRSTVTASMSSRPSARHRTESAASSLRSVEHHAGQPCLIGALQGHRTDASWSSQLFLRLSSSSRHQDHQCRRANEAKLALNLFSIVRILRQPRGTEMSNLFAFLHLAIPSPTKRPAHLRPDHLLKIHFDLLPMVQETQDGRL